MEKLKKKELSYSSIQVDKKVHIPSHGYFRFVFCFNMGRVLQGIQFFLKFCYIVNNTLTGSLFQSITKRNSQNLNVV